MKKLREIKSISKTVSHCGKIRQNGENYVKSSLLEFGGKNPEIFVNSNALQTLLQRAVRKLREIKEMLVRNKFSVKTHIFANLTI